MKKLMEEATAIVLFCLALSLPAAIIALGLSIGWHIGGLIQCLTN